MLLGFLYTQGIGVERNEATAFAWVLKAAEQGNAAGQAQLGKLYLAGRGVERDYGSAFKWAQKAAEQGN
jgi:TPR repeat protein